MEMQTIRAFFGWCVVINGGLMLFSFLVGAIAGDRVYQMHRKWFPISREAYYLAMYCFIGVMKILFLMLNLVPYLALVILS